MALGARTKLAVVPSDGGQGPEESSMGLLVASLLLGTRASLLGALGLTTRSKMLLVTTALLLVANSYVRSVRTLRT